MGSSIGILLDPVHRSFTKQVYVILCVFVILVQYRNRLGTHYANFVMNNQRSMNRKRSNFYSLRLINDFD